METSGKCTSLHQPWASQLWKQHHCPPWKQCRPHPCCPFSSLASTDDFFPCSRQILAPLGKGYWATLFDQHCSNTNTAIVTGGNGGPWELQKLVTATCRCAFNCTLGYQPSSGTGLGSQYQNGPLTVKWHICSLAHFRIALKWHWGWNLRIPRYLAQVTARKHHLG